MARICIIAAYENDMEAARWLIANGAEVNAKSRGRLYAFAWGGGGKRGGGCETAD